MVSASRWACGAAALCLALAPALALAGLAQALSPSAKAMEASGSAQALSPSAEDLAPLPERPAPLAYQPNVGWEDFTATTLVSLPFTALWSVLGALIVGGISQGKFPPEVDTPMIAGAASVAAAASLSIGLLSVSWGGPSPKPTQTPTP